MDANVDVPEEGELVDEFFQKSDRQEHSTGRKRPRPVDEFSGQREESDDDYEDRVMAALEVENEDDIIEASRRRRREILEKYRASAPNPIVLEEEKKEEEEEEEDIREDMFVEINNSVDDGAVEGDAAMPAAGMVELNEENGSQSDESGDMFADTPEEKPVKQANGTSGAHPKGLTDNYDDAEGYYNFQVGEILAEKYEVFATHGRGVFSSVLRARDVSVSGRDKGDCPQVAVKVIRANDTMYKAGKMERVILKKLSQADPEGKKHCIKMLDSFEYRNHLCLVFEPMDMNLRDLTKKYGRGIGLHINAVKVYAAQMFIALLHLQQCGVLHADIKPDNILVNESRTAVKICDFGSAMFSGDNEITPYLVSRFYRSPEVILGLPYDHPMDMWSIGCVIYELFTGQILFKGRTNNEMLKCMMDVKGPFPKKMIKKAEFAFKHFDLHDANLAFSLEEEDLVTKQPVKRNINNPVTRESFSKLLSNHSDKKKKVAQLVDLLERIFVFEPEKRITPIQALNHPFIKEQEAKNPYLSHAPRSLHRPKS